eukprot:scaffold10598_cov138-Isochrysis_galbana.AAC.1
MRHSFNAGHTHTPRSSIIDNRQVLYSAIAIAYSARAAPDAASPRARFRLPPDGTIAIVNSIVVALDNNKRSSS